jgi:acetyl esterase/lipase
MSVRRKCHVEERKVHDVYVYDLRLKDESKCFQGSGRADAEKSRRRRKQRIYWFAGGGWQMPADTSHWKFLMALLHELPPGTTASLVSYPLAPRNPAPTTFPLLMELYHTVLAEAAANDESVTLAGDSSGGEIVLCLTLAALTQNIHAPKPTSVLAICPSTDLTRENPMLKSIEKHDPILKRNFVKRTAAAWAGDWDKADTRISPLHSTHLDVFAKAGVKVDGCTAGYDILGPDGVLFRTKLAKNGVEGEWLDWDKMMHVWPLIKVYGICPESEEAFLWIADLLRRRGEEVEGEVTHDDGEVLEGVSRSPASAEETDETGVVKI